MLNIIKRKEAAPAPAQRDPFRLMRDLFHWDPLTDVMPTFDDKQWAASFNPDFEIKENKDGYVFKADLPGVKDADIDITVTGSRLTIKGRREMEQEDKGDTFYCYERTYGAFQRAFTLPDGADMEHLRADMKDGVLTLVVPKVPELKARKIELNNPQKS